MNEIGLIRRQLAIEQAHALEVSGAVTARDTASLEGLRHAARDYLACVLGSFAQRDAQLAALAARLPAGDPRRPALAAALAGPGASCDAQALLESDSWVALDEYLRGVWSARRAALDASLGASTPVTEWRQVAVIGADSVLEERTRYARVHAGLR